jgi:predicted metal-dependent enzyme (double-stranded beta helix superfamily)
MENESARAFSGLMQYCRQWSEELDDLAGEAAHIAYFQQALPGLLGDRPLIRSLLDDIAAGRPYPDVRKVGFFENEVLLYVDDRRRFSLRLYFHAGGEYTVIHDHNAWGVSGVTSGKLGIIRYRRLDDGPDAEAAAAESSMEYARLERIDHQILPAGEVAVTRPLAPGIHQTGNPEDRPNMMVTVYGRPARRLYIQEYDPVTSRVIRRYPPRLRKQRFAGQMLEAMIRN